MKNRILAAALAIACGTALAAPPAGDPAAERSPSTAASADNAPREGFVTKTKRALHRMGDKLRKAGHRNDAAVARGSDTRAMGAGPAGPDSQDAARRRRMDEAYANYRAQRK